MVSPRLLYAISSIWRVFPFGFLWIVDYLHLPRAFRRSSRPSSPSSAKASTVRPFFLNLFLKIYILCKFLRISNSTKFYLIFKDLFQKPKSLEAIYDYFVECGLWFSFSKPCLLRKEVIHPHVLVGIPCYDLTPIICPTLDGSLLR